MASVSIIIPVYKVKECYLIKCLESVVKQTMKDIQIVIIDDGAPSNCKTICQQYASRDERILMISEENKGVSVARNNGLEKAVGEYVLFVDADDWIEQDTCMRAYQYAKKLSSEIVIFAYDKVVGKSRIECRLKEEKIRYFKKDIVGMQLNILRYAPKYSNLNVCTPWCKLYKTEFLRERKVQFIPGLKRGEDMLFNLNALEGVKKVSSLDYIGYHYRINGASESQSFTPEITRLSRQILYYINQFIKENGKNSSFVEGYYAYTMSSLYEQMYMFFFHKDNPMSYNKSMRKFLEVIKSSPFIMAPYEVKLKNLPKKLQVLTVIMRIHGIKLFCYLYMVIRIGKDKGKKP